MLNIRFLLLSFSFFGVIFSAQMPQFSSERDEKAVLFSTLMKSAVAVYGPDGLIGQCRKITREATDSLPQSVWVAAHQQFAQALNFEDVTGSFKDTLVRKHIEMLSYIIQKQGLNISKESTLYVANQLVGQYFSDTAKSVMSDGKNDDKDEENIREIATFVCSNAAYNAQLTACIQEFCSALAQQIAINAFLSKRSSNLTEEILLQRLNEIKMTYLREKKDEFLAKIILVIQRALGENTTRFTAKTIKLYAEGIVDGFFMQLRSDAEFVPGVLKQLSF